MRDSRRGAALAHCLSQHLHVWPFNPLRRSLCPAQEADKAEAQPGGAMDVEGVLNGYMMVRPPGPRFWGLH